MKALLPLLLCACVAAPEVSSVESEVTVTAQRERVAGDVYHYTLRVGELRVHRVVRELAPFIPRPQRRSAMLLHGDFSTFATNFLPGLAPYLASHDIDVWGVDRRWTVPGANDSIADFATMGLAQEIADTRTALAFARGVRLLGGAGTGRMTLLGFSHGAELSYAVAATEGAMPLALRHVGALVALDFYGDLGDEDLRAQTCDFAAQEYALVAAGVTDSPNDFFIAAGQLAASAPDDPSPLLDGLTNRGAMLLLVGQTYQFAPFAPGYHLLAPTLDADGNPTGLRATSEAAANAWLAAATPHESMLEAADFDAYLCGDAPPVTAPLSNIRVPLYYVGAGGGIGALGLHATTSVSSTDVTARVVTQLPPSQQLSEFGHADLLFAAAAPQLVWQPLLTWLVAH